MRATPTNNDVNQAINTLVRYYYAAVWHYADDYASRIKAGEFEDRDTWQKDFDQTVGNSEWCIYYAKQDLCLLVSDSADVWQDQGIELPTENARAVMTYYALQADILERLEVADTDVDDDDTFDTDVDDDNDDGDK